MRQSRTSLASASVDRRTGLPKPICHSFAGCADRHASISRKLSRYVSWANAIARYCSVHGNVCTEWSPRYRATIRVNVLQGRQSISCENSVFPAFMGRPSPEKGRGNRRQLQIDTTENRRKAVIGQRLRSSSFALLRTAVICTDDGSYGEPGLVTAVLKRVLEQQTPDKVVAIGPMPMIPEPR